MERIKGEVEQLAFIPLRSSTMKRWGGWFTFPITPSLQEQAAQLGNLETMARLGQAAVEGHPLVLQPRLPGF